MPSDNQTVTPDAWAVCLASSLASELKILDQMVFHYPRELKSAGDIRFWINATIRELKEHGAETDEAGGGGVDAKR